MQYKWTALTVTTVGTLMAGIDSRIVIIGLPVIATQLRAGAEEAIWISQAYILASTVVLLLVGRIADLFGRVKLYNYGFIIFTVGSALSSLSLDPFQLIGFRILQGIGAGIVVTISSAIITDASPRRELGTMLGINQTAFRVGNVAGLTLSGLILSFVDWRGLFYVNIPIGIFGTIWAHKRLREISKQDKSKKMDWAGFILFSAGLSLVLLAITFLGYGAGGSIEGFGFLIVGAVLLSIFVKIESGFRFPLLDLRLFKIRLFAMGNLAQLLDSLAFGGITFLMALYMEIGLGYSPLKAGIGVIPLDGAYLVSTIVGGRLSDKYESRLLTTVGLLLNTVSLFFIATFGAATSYTEIALALLVIGTGQGLFLPPNLKAIMGCVQAERRGIASAFRLTMANVGFSVSYGLIVLFVTFGIPYNVFSPLLQGAVSGTSDIIARAEFLNGFQIAAFILGVLNTLAIVPSVMRGTKESGLVVVESVDKDRK